jgi:hypothetical protein
MVTATTARPRGLQFLASATLVAAICLALVRSRVFAAKPDVIGWAVTFDLTLTIPLLYWLFVGRNSSAAALRTATVFGLCCSLAFLIVPRGGQQMLRELRTVAVPIAEVVLIAALVLRIARMRKEAPTRGDTILTATESILGANRLSAVVASEVTMLRYALFGWSKPREREAGAFTVHERSGWGSVLACILVLIVAESFGMHLLIALRYPMLAWIWTAFDVWVVLWLLGDYNALRLRPSSIGGGVFHLRYGMRWTASIEVANIAAVERVTGEEQWKSRDVLKVAVLDSPRWLLRLREPVVVRGIAGITKRVTAIAILPDDEAPIEALRPCL